MGKFNIGEKVKFDGKVYTVIECHSLNWFQEFEPLIYGLVLAGKRPSSDRGDLIYVREGLLKPLTVKEKNTWRLLYGRK